MTIELLISTRKGLVVGRSEDREQWTFDAPHFTGWQVDYAVRDPRNGTIWVAVSHEQWGPHLHRSTDGGQTWAEATAPEFDGETYPDESGNSVTASLERVWTIEPGGADQPGVLYAGVDPAGLFISRDGGQSWELCQSLWEHPTRGMWFPGAAGMTLHHIQIDAADSSHLYVGISAAGVFESRDGGASWAARNGGTTGEHLPNPMGEAGQCVHSLYLSPSQPSRLFQQHHPGVYRSDDGGGQWIPIDEGLPGKFGFASTIDPSDGDTFYVIPLEFDQARVPPGGDLLVHRTRDAGASWEALGEGLPSGHVLQGVYRQALTNDGVAGALQHDDAPRALGLYMGTSGGHVYASADGGDHWAQILDHLAPVTSVRCTEVA